ncbi:hypothetical protein ACETK8_04735 [Brevundimonas staleyi]|uniref:Uncharacterized protein n=1 Tax=Brevundimonas staleyi TaxID=74326 RepID=A0ABW0FX70_9CAUL
MLPAMARTRFTVRTLVPILGIAVLVLGGISLWLVVSGAPRPSREEPVRMAERQIREQRGADWEVRYVEDGSGPVLCGYAAPRNRGGTTHEPVAFISRLGRVLFADEPLPTEFRDLRQRYCPAFARNPVSPVP